MHSMLLIADLLRNLYGVMLFIVALFLILLILIQRGRGGGLAGAFGGMGGQSAFGTKAGDTFTKITIGVATLWIILCIVGVKFGGEAESLMTGIGAARQGAVEEVPTGTEGFEGDETDYSLDPGASPEGVDRETSESDAANGANEAGVEPDSAD